MKKKIMNLLFLCTLLLPIMGYAEVINGNCEIKGAPNGRTIFQLNTGVGVQVLEKDRDWSKIRFRITNPSNTVEGEFIKPNSKLHVFVQEFKWDNEYGIIGTTLEKVKLDLLPMGGPSTKVSGYVIGYAKSANLTVPIVENKDGLAKLKATSYYRLELVDTKKKTYDVGFGATYHPIYCDIKVTRDKGLHLRAGNFLDDLIEFDIDGKGNVSGPTCFDTFCIEKIVIEGLDRFSFMVSGIKQSFVSTENLTEYSA
ncbi:MAG TPA: hypothetical protein VK654_04185, partial [Nitrospirota bacterium]|nr:hypothetical protein [Nitrospirota bacterium]